MSETTHKKEVRMTNEELSPQQVRAISLQQAIKAHADELSALAYRPDHELDGGVLDKAERYAEFLSSDE